MELISIKHDTEQKKVIIELPVELLVHALNENPNENAKILNAEKFADQFVRDLQEYHTQNSQELGITALQEFIDEVMGESIINCDEDTVTIEY